MLKVGDTIKCSSKVDMLNVHNDLMMKGIETDFLYEKDGVQGLWLVVEKVGVIDD